MAGPSGHSVSVVRAQSSSAPKEDDSNDRHSDKFDKARRFERSANQSVLAKLLSIQIATQGAAYCEQTHLILFPQPVRDAASLQQSWQSIQWPRWS